MNAISHWRVRTALAMVTLLAPAISHAQGDQNIVMRCTFDGYTNQTLDYVVDLAAKTISLTHTTEMSGAPAIINHFTGSITQVTDDKISWGYSDSYRTVTDSLNRYTGQIVEQIVSQTAGNFTVLMSCRRQQKQF